MKYYIFSLFGRVYHVLAPDLGSAWLQVLGHDHSPMMSITPAHEEELEHEYMHKFEGFPRWIPGDTPLEALEKLPWDSNLLATEEVRYALLEIN